MRRKLLALIVSLSLGWTTTGCAAATAQQPRGVVLASRDSDIALIGSYVRQLPLGSRVRVSLSDGTVIRGTLIKADGDPIAVQRHTRLPETPLQIPLNSVISVELEKRGRGGTARAVAIGVATGVGALLGVMLILAAIFSD